MGGLNFQLIGTAHAATETGVDMRGCWAIVLAGGSGSRLSEETRLRYGRPRPKQYCDFDGTGTLLAHTLRRAGRVAAPERTVVVTTRGWGDFAADTLREFPGAHVVEQPANLETTCGIALGALAVSTVDPAAVVALFPSDHHVAEPDRFAAGVAAAVAEAATHRTDIVLVGADTARAEEGYGWIVPEPSTARCPTVRAFREKPDVREAHRLLADGARINTFVMAADVRTLSQRIATFAPGHWRTLSTAWPDGERLDGAYAVLPASNFSREVLEPLPVGLRLYTLPPCGWSDVGTPDRLRAAFGRSVPPPPPEVKRWRAASAPRATGSARVALR